MTLYKTHPRLLLTPSAISRNLQLLIPVQSYRTFLPRKMVSPPSHQSNRLSLNVLFSNFVFLDGKITSVICLESSVKFLLLKHALIAPVQVMPDDLASISWECFALLSPRTGRGPKFFHYFHSQVRWRSPATDISSAANLIPLPPRQLTKYLSSFFFWFLLFLVPRSWSLACHQTSWQWCYWSTYLQPYLDSYQAPLPTLFNMRRFTLSLQQPLPEDLFIYAESIAMPPLLR